MAVYTGSSLHEVAHVAGAGNAMDPTDALGIAGTATITKMIRVMMLAPVLVVMGFVLGRRKSSGACREKSKIAVPWFAFGFIGIICLNSLLQYLFGVESVREIPLNGAIEYADTFLLTMAMTALGTETSIDKFRQAGAKPFVLAGLLYVWLVQRYPAAEKRKAMAWQGIATLLCVLSTWGMLRIFRVQAGESGQAALQAGQMMRRPLLGLAVAGILLTLPFAARSLRFLMGNRVMGWLAAVSMNYYLLHQNLAVHLKRLGVPPSVSAEPNRAGEQPWQLQYTLLCFGLSLLGAALITLLIEKPCAKVLKKMFARGKAENKA